MKEEKEQKVGFCQYCGHAAMVPGECGSTQEDWDEEATRRCNCEDAARIRWKTCVLDQFCEDIKGIDMTDIVRAYLVKGAELMTDGAVKNVTVKTDMDETIKISMRGTAIFMKKTKQNTEELLSEGMYRQ